MLHFQTLHCTAPPCAGLLIQFKSNGSFLPWLASACFCDQTHCHSVLNAPALVKAAVMISTPQQQGEGARGIERSVSVGLPTIPHRTTPHCATPHHPKLYCTTWCRVTLHHGAPHGTAPY